MSSRLQDIHNAYHRKKVEAENNEKILKDVISSLEAISSSLSEETVAIINSYHPGLLDLLNFEVLSNDGKFNGSNKNIETLKTNINYVLDELMTNMERELV